MSSLKIRINTLPALACCAALIVGLFAPLTVSAETAERYLVRYQLGAKADVLAELGPEAVVHHEFDDLGVVAATVSDATVQRLLAHASVVSVSEDPIYHLYAQSTPYGIDMVNARDEWDADRDGVIDAGAATGDAIRVCIVDTGIALDHEDLGGGGVTVLAGQSFVGEDWAADRQGHGTHVAGTVAAMNNGVGVVGVSPGEVHLLIADVFNDAGDGQASSTILAAANWCADQGADIISMSLGGLGVALGDGYQGLRDRGVLVIAAAGNDGAPVTSYPAGYASVVSVGAVDATETVADFSNFNTDVEVSAPGVAVESTYPFENSLALTAGPKYNANGVANTEPTGSTTGILADGGDCNVAPAAGAYSGKVVLCERGGGTFGLKIDNAAAGGAVAAVLYNNEPGNFSGTYGNVCCSTIPAISISQADGQDAVTRVGTEATVNLGVVSTAGYASLSGTSMATPHASAVAAVIWSACPELTHDQVRSHLAATTRESQADLVPGRDIFYGHGMVQVKQGVDALSDGVDEYDPAAGNGDGNNPANVECPSIEPPPPPGGEARASGGGWLAGYAGKLTFGFEAEATADGGTGQVSFHDHGLRVKVKLSEVDSVSALTSDCGPVAAGANAVAILGSGTYNKQPATFRVCVADNGEPGKDADTFFLECTSGCAYASTGSAPQATLGGGNIQVATSAAAGEAADGEASAVVLDPLLIESGVAGGLQVFTAQVFDAAGVSLAGAAVTLESTAADGTVTTTQAVADATGIAIVVGTLPAGVTEYRALAGAAESNPVIVRGE